MNLYVQIAQLLIFPGLTFFVWIAFVFEWLERKTSARVQGRLGPIVAGPFGILQPVADFIKLNLKEEIIPEFSDRVVFSYGPPLLFSAPAVGLVFIPVAGPEAILTSSYGLLFILFILSFSSLMTALMGYSSAGRYSTIAIGRLILQYVSYEIPLALSIVSAGILAGTLSIDGIVSAQSRIWFVVLAPLSFVVFIIASLAELEKPPFDIPSAKTEIVAGWMTEFSGRTLAYIKLAENLSYVFLAAIAVTLFLGGPSGPMFVSNPLWQNVLYTFYFLIKLLGVGFLIFTLKTALARVRIDQATELFWLVLTPLCLLQIGIILLFL